MKDDFIIDEWKVIEDGFKPASNRVSESIFSLGNGRMGLRGNFEEHFSGNSLQGNYIGGIYYADHVQLDHTKGNRPQQVVKFLNAPNWIGISISFDGEVLDLDNCQVQSFRRELDLRKGYLERTFVAKMKSGRKVQVSTRRFCSMADQELGAIRYTITPLDFDSTLTVQPYLDADVSNEDADENQKFWVEVDTKVKRRGGYLLTETKKTFFQVCTAMKFSIFRDEKELDFDSYRLHREKYIGCEVDMGCKKGETITICKYASIVTSLDHPDGDLPRIGKKIVKKALKKGFDQLSGEHAKAWKDKWSSSDVTIDGDPAAQQAIRFNIFQLHQAYNGRDSRMSIASRGFTGEKYGGCTFWDAEAYGLPFFLATTPADVSRNLLQYRANHLGKAIENAEKLGFNKGAAFYPMVTINGEEAHHSWEVTLEEIHRNGAIAYAIFEYIRYTGDEAYLAEGGLEVLIAIARFWAQRVHYSERREAYVIHGVTGPNEYENNINNNWYTNYIAKWCLEYTLSAVEYVKSKHKKWFEKLSKKLKFEENAETSEWQKIAKKLYLKEDKKLGIFVQQDTFLDKELTTVADLKKGQLPLYQNWTWDRILRSVYLKQADVLQGIYAFEEAFDQEQIRRNYEFYEARTVHESPLSPCVHSILAARIGLEEQAYEFYRQSARTDLDDQLGDTAAGLHINAMGASWLCLVKGLGGMRISNTGGLSFAPILPKSWKNYTFRIQYRGQLLQVKVSSKQLILVNHSQKTLHLKVYDKEVKLEGGKKEKLDR
ncbi:family 65 glycosyl hydrolase domain-containing protein [Flavilitoribacter nigricans]|uniref:Family 65 glycosyl hydrolase n=1 Tax=Flavilitoribacter nigricans (strain ATCC 23147 / DSM 23189 / NBRC 102662 / NCIMB 1420 / SS-2) TaxID=1122177 RepID=A0A2D0NJM8_FLAN2|nr:family 65 glycosyl hydrolase domain-containing protein [Flavilitoribacter nigricans]PHN08704.1 family 65 glycosyl hydrolase [Flavilitoribacter nigricans DSM 23189 = NBRC 102662]